MSSKGQLRISVRRMRGGSSGLSLLSTGRSPMDITLKMVLPVTCSVAKAHA
jgi:hypothetical protein